MRIVAVLGTLLLAGVAVTAVAQEEATSTTPGPAVAAPVSLARIVRLSQIRSHVFLDRNTGSGYEAAFANLPIVQGAKLKTTDGVAEVEFEDNSSMRLVPETAVEFPTLQSGAGGMVSAVRVTRGTLYVSLVKGKGNPVTVLAGESTVVLLPGSHIRLHAGEPESKVTVLSGSAEVRSASGTVVVGKNKALLLDRAALVETAKEEPTPFDTWDKTSADYHKVRSVAAAYGGGSGYAYGVNDLNYYGGFSEVGGCGQVWRPYFASAAWDPFANGIWAFYPGAGYSWVSPYPWGWTPFHSGSWAYCGQGTGWGWRPSAGWTGLQNMAIANSALHCVKCLKPPPAPIAGRSTLVEVNAKPLEVSKVGAGDKFVFRGDSAGLGVPRETFGNLRHVSSTVLQRGSAEATLEPRAFGGLSGVGPVRGATAGGTAGGGTARGGSATSVHSSGAGSSAAATSAPHSMSAPAPSSGAGPAGGSAAHH